MNDTIVEDVTNYSSNYDGLNQFNRTYTLEPPKFNGEMHTPMYLHIVLPGELITIPALSAVVLPDELITSSALPLPTMVLPMIPNKPSTPN